MRIPLLILFGVFSLAASLAGGATLEESQVVVLLERYEEGIRSGRFAYRAGMERSDLESYLRSGRISEVRSDVIRAIEQAAPTPVVSRKFEAPSQRVVESSSGWGSDEPSEAVGSWGESSGWVSADERSESTMIDSLLSGIREASASCDYAEAKRLADLVLDSDPTQSWVIENYPEIERWAEKSALYFDALTAAYEELEGEDFDAMASHLRVALRNAASNCGQDTVAQSLLEQAAEASQSDRLAAIELAKLEGSIHQRTFVQNQIAREEQVAEREKKKSGMKRGLMGLLGTAIKVGTLKQAGNLSSEDALNQVLQQEVAQANPELAQLISQYQQLDGAGMGAGDEAALLSALQSSAGSGQSNVGLAQLLMQAQQLSGSSNAGSSGDLNALLQALQAQGSQSNPQLAELLAQSQLKSAGGGSGGPALAQPGFGGGIGNGATQTDLSQTSLDGMSPICRRLYEELEKLGEKMKPYSELVMSYQSGGGGSIAQLQSAAAEIQKLELQTRPLIKKLKENDCPGADQIPDLPQGY